MGHACREAQENGDYAAAFLLCAEGCRILESLQSLSVTGELFASVNRLYADTISRLEAALSSTCADFEATQYSKVRTHVPMIWRFVPLIHALSSSTVMTVD